MALPRKIEQEQKPYYRHFVLHEGIVREGPLRGVNNISLTVSSRGASISIANCLYSTTYFFSGGTYEGNVSSLQEGLEFETIGIYSYCYYDVMEESRAEVIVDLLNKKKLWQRFFLDAGRRRTY